MLQPTPINLNDLLLQRTVEGERIEYKEGWNPDAIVRTLCAFANDFENLGGGYVVIGQDCDANGQPVFPPKGLAENQLDKIQQELLAACQLIQPLYFPVLSVEVVQDRHLIVLWAPGGQNRPYKAPEAVTSRHKVWHHYIRRYSSTVQAKGEVEQELLSLAAKVPWDDRFHQAASVSVLSKPLMQAFLQEVDSALAADAADLSVEALGRQMNVVGGPDESPWPRNVGLLFFSDQPTHFVPGAQVDVVAFPQGSDGDVIVEKSFKGPLSQMTREALEYLRRNYLYETVTKHSQRAEATRAWNFPFAAVEEALVNAVYHRTYESRDPVEVRISPQELVILSYPGPDRSVRMEDLQAVRAVSRRYRNRRIGEFLKELRLTEGRATGIPKILKAMRTNGSPLPVFETDEERLSFVVRLPIHPSAKSRAAEVTAEVTAEVARLLGVLEGEMPRASLMEAVGLKHAEHFRKAYLSPALAGGLVEMTMPDKPNSRNQRYRLTRSGADWVQRSDPRRP
ncbi:Fic family protein [Paracidovorax valerianellae]|uniref:ATP-dependent DNA helicase RecG n=1 Tax=Paracidovorax valerianellae TaxID=187868 RepID=A0A1G6ZIC9_9BURK|nr:ATP-binding protein [Paracidovorax valerianellae]MDA8444318.1 putative DNA binding domain-containing protein [Paracidovorax valerianellae]SDE02162.1 ATP-dependent DNA helicase RecG [Paracidovorax valerianellae]